MTDSKNSLDAVIGEARALTEQMKREHWQELIQDEANGKIPYGCSIVEMHDEFCGELEASLTSTIRELHLIDQEFQHEKAGMQIRANTTISLIYDAALDYHLEHKTPSSKSE